MNHDDAARVLTEFMQGRLRGAEWDAVAGHVSECSECGAMAAAYEVLKAARPGRLGGNSSAHPSTWEIAVYAALPSKLDEQDLARIGAHLQACSACSEEVERVRRAEEATGRHRVARPGLLQRLFERHKWRSGALAAAALLFLILAYPAWLALVEMPRLSQEASRLAREREMLQSRARDLRSLLGQAREEALRSSGWSGPVRLQVLRSPVRGSGSVTIVAVASGQPFIPLAVLPPALSKDAPGDPYLFEIRDEKGGAVWSARMTAAEIRDELRASQVVTFLVPASILPPARYVLRLLPVDGAAGEPLLEARFEVVSLR